MKHLFSLLYCFLLVAAAYAQDIDDPYHDGPQMADQRLLAAMIKTEQAFECHFGKNGIKDSVLISDVHFTYDNKGVLQTRQQTDGRGISLQQYMYDSIGRVHKLITYSGKSAVKQLSHPVFHEYVYDTTGSVRFMYRYDADTSHLSIINHIYNSKNQLITVTLKLDTGSDIALRNLTYDDEGRLMHLDYLDVDGAPTAMYAFGYDAANRQQLVYAIVNGIPKLYRVFTFNARNKRIKTEEYNYVELRNVKNALPVKNTRYYYDDNGLLAIEVTMTNGKLTNYIEYKYTK